MKALRIVAAAALVASGLTMSGAAQGQQVTGTLMDVMCSTEHASDANFAANHDKKCLLMDGCVKSGYSLVTSDRKVLKFDAKGNQLALDLIKKTDREKNWTVAVTGAVTGDTIAVTDIKMR